MAKIEFLTPDTLYKSPVYSQAVVIPAGSAIVIVGGQNGVGTDGKIVSKDVAKQSAKAIENVEAALDAAGCTMDDLVQVRIHMVAGSDLKAAYEPWMKKRGDKPNPPVVTMGFVPALANPDFLIEIEGTAVRR